MQCFGVHNFGMNAKALGRVVGAMRAAHEEATASPKRMRALAVGDWEFWATGTRRTKSRNRRRVCLNMSAQASDGSATSSRTPSSYIRVVSRAHVACVAGGRKEEMTGDKKIEGESNERIRKHCGGVVESSRETEAAAASQQPASIGDSTKDSPIIVAFRGAGRVSLVRQALKVQGAFVVVMRAQVAGALR